MIDTYYSEWVTYEFGARIRSHLTKVSKEMRPMDHLNKLLGL